MTLLPQVTDTRQFGYRLLAGSAPQGPASRTRVRPGPARIVNERFTLVDRSRPTPPHGRQRGRTHRVLHGEVWRPAALCKAAPLVVYNHGFMSSRRESLYLVRFLASHGYTVAALDFPLTGLKAPGKPKPEDIVNQPGDVSYLIDYLLARNADAGDAMYATIDPQKIAVAGLSYGALTSMLASYHRELLDPRISAAVLIAGPGSMLSPDFFAGDAPPALLIYGDADSLVHYDDHALPLLRHVPQATLVTLRAGSHTGFAQHGSTLLRFLKNPDSLTCTVLRWKMDERPWDFVSALGGSDMGVVEPEEEIAPLTRPCVRVAMKAARQQMFTTLATHAFLESRFASSSSLRERADRFLRRTLPEENGAEVAVA